MHELDFVMQARNDLVNYQARLRVSREHHAEPLAMARKAIAESLKLIAEADAIISSRRGTTLQHSSWTDATMGWEAFPSPQISL